MKKILFFLPLLIISSCATPYNTYKVEIINDEFDGYKIERMYGNYLADDPVLPSLSVMFNAQRFTDKDGLVTYQLHVEYNGSDWLFIDPGETLVLLIDGERVGLIGYGSENHREVISGMSVGVRETSIFDADKFVLKQIANAKSVKLKLTGRSRNIQLELTKEHIDNYKKFVEYLGI